jgi:hypothetical protein
MSQVLDFPDGLCGGVRGPRHASGEPEETWPGVNCRPHDAATDRANAPARVLFEVFLVLASAGALAAMVTALVPGP